LGTAQGFQQGSGRLSTVARSTGFVQTAGLRDEIVEYSDSIFEPMATAAVDRRSEAVIDQLKPKQRCTINIGLRIPKHANLAVADRSERNRRFWTVARNGRESAVGPRNFQFGQRLFEGVAVCQNLKSPKGKTQAADVASWIRYALVMTRQSFVNGRRNRLWERSMLSGATAAAVDPDAGAALEQARALARAERDATD
jgi:hypothetical protein